MSRWTRRPRNPAKAANVVAAAEKPTGPVPPRIPIDPPVAVVATSTQATPREPVTTATATCTPLTLWLRVMGIPA